MEGASPAGRTDGPSNVRSGGEATGRIAKVLNTPQWSVRSQPGRAVGTGMGTRREQPGPEHGVGRLGPGVPARSADSETGEPPVMSPSSWLTPISRSGPAETRWLQPAHANRGAPRPWTKSSVTAPIAHRVSRSKRLDFIQPSPSRGRLHALENLTGTDRTEPQTRKNVMPLSDGEDSITHRVAALQEVDDENARTDKDREIAAPDGARIS